MAARRVLVPGGRLVVCDMMFALTLESRNRRLIVSKCVSIARRGPAGWLRIVRNAGRIAAGRWEHPAPPEAWGRMLAARHFTAISTETLEHEGGIACAVRPCVRTDEIGRQRESGAGVDLPLSIPPDQPASRLAAAYRRWSTSGDLGSSCSRGYSGRRRSFACRALSSRQPPASFTAWFGLCEVGSIPITLGVSDRLLSPALRRESRLIGTAALPTPTEGTKVSGHRQLDGAARGGQAGHSGTERQSLVRATGYHAR
jgi:hypothetical protein